ncbi:hypothetical protein ACFLZB_01670 [Nanoarchaeota archaeon]
MKKGGIRTFLVGVIIVAIVGVVLAIFLVNLRSTFGESQWLASCEVSVRAYRQVGPMAKIYCPVLSWEVKEDLNSNEAKEEVLEKMKTCYDLYVEEEALFEEGLSCAPCYNLTFSGKGEMNNLKEFITNSTDSEILGLKRSGFGENVVKLSSLDQIEKNIKTGKQYYVIYAEADDTLGAAWGVFLMEKEKARNLCFFPVEGAQ